MLEDFAQWWYLIMEWDRSQYVKYCVLTDPDIEAQKGHISSVCASKEIYQNFDIPVLLFGSTKLFCAISLKSENDVFTETYHIMYVQYTVFI